jgi:hypothetical protein
MTSALLALAALALGATGYPRFRDDQTGVWREPSFRVVDQGDLRPADVEALRRRLDRVSEVIARGPALARIGAYDVKRYQGVFARPLKKGKPGRRPDRAEVMFLTFRYTQVCPTCPVEPSAESTHSIKVTFNHPFVLPRSGVGSDERGEIHVEPPIQGHLGGLPIYHRRLLVLQRDPSRPLFAPVSQERWIRAKLAGAEKGRAADARRGKVNEGVERRIAALQAELDGLSPAERAAQAAYARGATRRPSGLAEPGQPSRPLVEHNRELFDPSLPRSVLQLAIVTTSPVEPPANSISAALLDGVDLQAILAIMREP